MAEVERKRNMEVVREGERAEGMELGRHSVRPLLIPLVSSRFSLCVWKKGGEQRDGIEGAGEESERTDWSGMRYRLNGRGTMWGTIDKDG